MSEILGLISWKDVAALAFFIGSWIGYAQFSNYRTRKTTRSLLDVTNDYRKQWMVEMLKRDNRSPDAIMVGNLQRSIAFFANTTIFIILGLVSMLGYHDRFSAIMGNIPFASVDTAFTWEIKIFVLLITFIYSFFKYTWSLRQYNYAGIFISAAPPFDECKENAALIAAKGGFLVGNAANHFNNGLRAYYFGLAALAWFIHAYCFIVATALVVYVTHRREYHSSTLANLTR